MVMRLLTTLLARIGTLRNYRFSPAQFVGLVVAFGLFFILAVVRFPTDQMADVRLVPGVAAVVLAPTTILVNAAGYRAQAGLINIDVPYREALRTTLIGSAANLLPVPGAAVVRSGALVDRGATLKQAGGSTAVGALSWLGWSLFVAVPPLLSVGGGATAGLVAAAGILAIGFSLGMALRLGASLAGWGLVALTSVGLVVALAVRYLLLVWALGFDPTGTAVALVAVGALSSAAGFFPGGIGIRELLAGATATIVDLPAELGFLVAAIDDLAYVVITMVGVLGFCGGWSTFRALWRDRAVLEGES